MKTATIAYRLYLKILIFVFSSITYSLILNSDLILIYGLVVLRLHIIWVNGVNYPAIFLFSALVHATRPQIGCMNR